MPPRRRCDRPQHQRMCHLDLFSLRKQVIVDPAGEDRCFHGDRPGLGKCLDPAVQLAAGGTDLPFLMHIGVPDLLYRLEC
jgi:hypothetical protein